MYLPIGYVSETRYERLTRAAKAKIDWASALKNAATPQNVPAEIEELSSIVRDHLGTRIRNIVPAALLHLPVWLAEIIWDIFSRSNRVDLESGQLQSIKRVAMPIPSINDLRAFMVEEQLPSIPLPPDTYLTPRDVAVLILDTLSGVAAVEAYAPNADVQLQMAARHLLYEVREGKKLGQFEKTYLNLVVTGVLFPSMRALVPEHNPTALEYLTKVRARTKTCAALDIFTLYGTGSIDGIVATVLPYVQKLPICQGTIFNYTQDARVKQGIVRMNVKQVEEFVWNLDSQLIGQLESRSGRFNLSKLGGGVAPGVVETNVRVPYNFVAPARIVNHSVLMDHSAIDFVYRNDTLFYQHYSGFRSRVIQTRFDTEFLLAMLMNEATRRKVVSPPVEAMSLDKQTNVILVDGDKYTVEPPTSAVFHFLKKTTGGFERASESVDLRPIYGYGNFMVRPALHEHVRVDRNAIFRPCDTQVQRVAAILGLDDLSTQASHILLTVCYNAHWVKMALGVEIDITPFIALLSAGAGRA